jgi:hypothetical protein
MDPKSLLVRIEMEYENGEIVRLTGDNAKEWSRACVQESMLAYNHGMRFPTLEWETVRKAKGCP